MRKIDLIIENIRDEYMINLLEEGEVSELEALKTKKFLNESLGRIRGILVEEGALDAVKQHLANNWGKYLAGLGAAGAGVAAYHYLNGGEPAGYGDMPVTGSSGEDIPLNPAGVEKTIATGASTDPRDVLTGVGGAEVNPNAEMASPAEQAEIARQNALSIDRGMADAYSQKAEMLKRLQGYGSEDAATGVGETIAKIKQ